MDDANMDAMVTLDFVNTQVEGIERIHCHKKSVHKIMAWYGSYCAGDDYSVYLNDKKIPHDMNGEVVPITIEATPGKGE